MSKTFFGFAIADSMFASDCTITRKSLTADEAKVIISKGVEPCLNPSHQATINAMNSRFDIHVAIPEVAPKVLLQAGDSLLVMGVRGLPRLDATRHEYTNDEIASATFVFSLYTVQA
ncbi:MAG: hypothetical protein Q4A69_08430 [Moraxella sp.]|nr:hypothetical protein [Moraxella sp.]